jgi:flavin reductase (DIM6/NTAB) family NADH-FMN oxidoreductase RutF
MVDAVIGVGNAHGPDVDKFAKFGLTPGEPMKVGAPLVAECHASFECRLADGRMIDRRSLFIFEVVKSRVAFALARRQTLTAKTRRREGTTLRGECRFDLSRTTAAAARAEPLNFVRQQKMVVSDPQPGHVRREDA